MPDGKFHSSFTLVIKLAQRGIDTMECYCLHNSVIEEMVGECRTADEIGLIYRRFPCQNLYYFTGVHENIIINGDLLETYRRPI